MNNEELKEVLLNESPVIFHSRVYGDIKYKKVSGIIYRSKKQKIVISAEVQDYNDNSVSIVNPEFLERE